MSKAVAGREKDREFCMAMLAHGYVKPVEVLGQVEAMPIEVQGQRRLRSAILDGSRSCESAATDCRRIEFLAGCSMRVRPGRCMLPVTPRDPTVQLFNPGVRAFASCRNNAGSGIGIRRLGWPDSGSRSMRMSGAAPGRRCAAKPCSIAAPA